MMSDDEMKELKYSHHVVLHPRMPVGLLARAGLACEFE
jgi:hypothetical protein